MYLTTSFPEKSLFYQDEKLAELRSVFNTGGNYWRTYCHDDWKLPIWSITVIWIWTVLVPLPSVSVAWIHLLTLLPGPKLLASVASSGNFCLFPHMWAWKKLAIRTMLQQPRHSGPRTWERWDCTWLYVFCVAVGLRVKVFTMAKVQQCFDQVCTL